MCIRDRGSIVDMSDMGYVSDDCVRVILLLGEMVRINHGHKVGTVNGHDSIHCSGNSGDETMLLFIDGFYYKGDTISVSYTHLDVYKRQMWRGPNQETACR